MPEPFLLRAIAAAIGLAIIAAPLGCVVVWNRMAYFGETIAQAGLIGVALALALQIDITLGIVAVAILAGLIVLGLTRQRLVPIDSVLGLMHYGALSLGVISAASLAGPSVDLMGYLFGDIFAVAPIDLYWIYGGGIVILGAIILLWEPLLRLAVHDELAAAEGVPREAIRAAFVLLLAVTIAFAIKIVGILLVIAFLIVPAVAARPFSRTPEVMVALTALIAILGVALGLFASWEFDAPGGPAIVLSMACLAAMSVLTASYRRSED